MSAHAQARSIFIGNTLQKQADTEVTGEYVTLLDDSFYRIHNYDAMAPFFMTIVSGSDHWLFIGTTGGLSAGRISAEHALFPYYTADKIIENSDNTGSKTVLLVTSDAQTRLWEPFSERTRDIYAIERNLYKNVSGTAVIFEEINHDLGLRYRTAWRTSHLYGFVKTSWLVNQGEGCQVELLDGLQNLLPASVTSGVQNVFSVLLDAYKRSELEPQTGLGIFALSSRLADLPEPKESLRATTVWQSGLENVTYLLSSAQLDCFRRGQGVTQETDIRGQRSAYFVHTALDLGANEERTWHLVAEVEQDSAAIARLSNEISRDSQGLYQRIEQDIAANTEALNAIVGSADGLQVSDDRLGTAHHFANVMFNVMRGGIFADSTRINVADLRDYVAVHNHALLRDQADFFAALPETIQVGELRARADATGATDLIRLCYTYLPLTFSRRHGDPSRPWNRFAINVRKPDGTQRLDYEGNWRDIFQNWEALAYSYPEFTEGMIATFLNATTGDGYNPYRVTRHGIDWEAPEPSNPWANIGYWSDHQIIYLQKLMEVCQKFYPAKLGSLLNRPIFSTANVPYRIKDYAALLKDPYETITFDFALEKKIEGLVHERGADGKLVLDANGRVLHTTLGEKLLILLLAKLVNFVPEGGLWMNTQRPEWNDANNALVGKGLSVVTLCYLRRFIAFFADLVGKSGLDSIHMTEEVATLFVAIWRALTEHESLLDGAIGDEQRRAMMDALGQAGSDYREGYYQAGFSGAFAQIATADLVSFLTLAQQYIEHTLRANKRADNLYHSYNILRLKDNRASVGYLDEMLEGQVAILSSGLLLAEEGREILHTLRQSALYREDQHSYILYPNRQLAGFLHKNRLSEDDVRGLGLVAQLVAQRDHTLIVKDANGVYHFAGDIQNAKDVKQALATLAKNPHYASLVEAESEAVLDLFERVFNHDAFTGRSGTFFAYEGLGSIYWHMVSKLLLAAQENAQWAAESGAFAETVDALIDAYYDIRAGIGFNKAPDVYGAFPTDPYSHTPEGQGAKQPGMTGMVKEEILTRLAEVGLDVQAGQIVINPLLLNARELLTVPATFAYIDVEGQKRQIDLPAGSLGYTFCQVPIVLHRADQAQIVVTFSDGRTQEIAGDRLDGALSQHIFIRDGVVRELRVGVRKSKPHPQSLPTA